MINTIRIKDIAILNRETFKKGQLPNSIRYLDTGNLTKNTITRFQVFNTRTDKIPCRAQRKVSTNTILYSTVRPNQEHYGIINRDSSDAIVSTGFTTIDIIDESVNPRFLYYKLTQNHITDFLHTIGMGAVSAYPSISANDIGNLEFQIPNISTQESIVKVLSNLETKIEVNNKINSELEAMAKLIYDYWFVQFDFPISEKIADSLGKPELKGKPYKSSGGKMVYNKELKREIPEGWESRELLDIANITMGQSPPGDSYNEEGKGEVFYQGCTDFGSRFPINRKFTTKPKRRAKKGDILLSVRAPVGTMNIANEDCCIGRGLASLNSKDNCVSYLDGVLQYMKQIFDRRNSDGTTFGSITKGDLFSLPVIKPCQEILLKFDSIANPIFEKQNTIGKESQKLMELRDWLLPMLMNGQVKVN